MTAAASDVIRRKIDRARLPVAEGAPGADRGWRLALARAARDAMGLDLEFRALSISRLSLAEILEVVPDRALLALLDGPHGGLGVIMLGPTVTAALIEKQTLGRLAAQPSAPRKASRIDAAMVAGVIDRALVALDETLVDEADQSWAGGFRYASYLDDPRPLGFMLEEEAYRALSADVWLGAGREGRVILVLPATGRGVIPIAQPAEDTSAPLPFSAGVSEQVMQVESRLDAVIGRLVIPLRQIMAMQVGETLVLPQATLDALSLETLDGRHVARVRLGQHRGMRAIKLGEANIARPAVAAPLRSAVSPQQGEPPLPPELRAAG